MFGYMWRADICLCNWLHLNWKLKMSVSSGISLVYLQLRLL